MSYDSYQSPLNRNSQECSRGDFKRVYYRRRRRKKELEKVVEEEEEENIKRKDR